MDTNPPHSDPPHPHDPALPEQKASSPLSPIDPLGPPEGMSEFSFKWALTQEPPTPSKIIFDVGKNLFAFALTGGTALVVLLLPGLTATCGATRSVKMEWDNRKEIIQKVIEEQQAQEQISTNEIREINAEDSSL